MVRYHSDTESDSYRYDDSNSSEEPDTDLDIPQFSQKSATQIAEYLDSKLNNTKTRSISVNTSTHGNQNGISNNNNNITSNNNNYNHQSNTNTYPSPATEKIWTPLSQSTPADISSTKAQPKDIIKAKSRLSNLAVSADMNDSVNDASDESDDSNEKLSQDTSFQDTPSKSSKKKPSSNLQKQSNPIQAPPDVPKFEEELKELKELRELKQYLSQLPQGSMLLESFSSSQEEKQYGVYKVVEIDQKDDEIKKLKEQTKFSEKQRETLKEEAELYKSSNERLKEEISLISKSNDNFKDNISFQTKTNTEMKKEYENSVMKLSSLQQSNEELEKELKDVRLKLKSILGDPEEANIESKHPSLQDKEANGKTVYENLEIGQIDDMNISKSHRLLKNILINLEIPLSQAKHMIPKIANLLQSEDILLDFANKVHLLLYNRKLNIDKFQREKEGGEHLYQCTKQMYDNIELLVKALDAK